MRRRDVFFLCLIGGTLLAGLAWALSTQVRWVQESKAPRPQPPAKAEEAETPPPPQGGTGVVGEVSEDTRAAMARDLARRKARSADPKPVPRK
ncbi:hypothetical protein GETHLI_21840 [Geothrix limicola]|uniref:Uncharacterized protein n=1 Tax=Geothrix limicola TaxID=2927978 RepID=A0ABQ5QGG2_9BACT|nr:hypothetical protein [Geothrix limicola]GLH73682.1 hypothetical protein GETHLI_21840 [Geothrix limicola]